MAISRIKQKTNGFTGIQESSNLIYSKLFYKPKDTSFQVPIYVGGASKASAGGDSGPIINLSSELSGGVGSIQEGDIVIAVVGYGSTSNIDVSLVTSGYTELVDLYSNDTVDTNLGVYYKIMGAIPDTTIEASGSGDLAFAEAMIVHVWRNIDIFNPIDVITTIAISTNSAEANPPAITTVSNNAVVLAIGASGNDNSTVQFTQPGNLSNFISIGSADTEDITLGIGSIATTFPTTVDPGSFTITTNADYSWAAATVALRPTKEVKDTITLTTGNYIFDVNYGEENYGTNISFLIDNKQLSIYNKTFLSSNSETKNIYISRPITFDTVVHRFNNALEFYNGLFFALTKNTLSAINSRISTDGITWTNTGTVFSSSSATGSFTNTIGSYIFVDKKDNSYYVQESDDYTWSYSTDFITWSSTDAIAFTTRNFKVVKYLNDFYFAADSSSDGFAQYSTNKITWTTILTGGGTTVEDFQYFKGKYYYLANGLAARGRINASTDLVTWTTVFLSFSTSNGLYSLATNGDILVAAGLNQNDGILKTLLLSSTDGISWTTATTINYSSTRDIRNLTYQDDIFVGVDGYKNFVYSYDGVNWLVLPPSGITLTSTTLTSQSKVVYGNQKMAFSTPSTSGSDSNIYPIIIKPVDSVMLNVYKI